MSLGGYDVIKTGLRYLFAIAMSLLALPAMAWTGVDGCAQLNAIIAALPTRGGYVDATSLTGVQTCDVSMNIDRPVRIQFGSSVWILNSDPGIHISTYGPVILEGVGFEYNYVPSSPQGTVLKSGGASALILDSGSQGSQIINLELDGNNTGTFGFLSSLAGGMVWQSVHIHNFVYAGLIALGGVNTYHDLMINDNGGDGIVVANDITMDGNTQLARNRGAGFHALAGGTRLTDVDSDHNMLHGMYFDGRRPMDWLAGVTYVVPTLIRPLTANPGSYYFLSVNVNGTANSTPPGWTQVPNSVLMDGSVAWLNVGTLPYLQPSSMIVNFVNGGYVDDNGNGEPDGFVSDNIRIEGAAPDNRTANSNHVNGTYVSQAQVTKYRVRGLHILNAGQTEVTGLNWLGGAWNNTPSLDAGGVVIEGSSAIVVSGMTSLWSASNSVRIMNSADVIVQGVSAINTGNSAVTQQESFCILVDEASTRTSLSQITCTSDNGYGRGIFNGGTSTTLSGYQNSTTAVPKDALANLASLTDASGNAEFNSVHTPSAAINELQAATLYVAGSGSFNSMVASTAALSSLQASSISVTGEIDAGAIRVGGDLLVAAKPVTSWTLPILGSTGVVFPTAPGVALRTAFEIPAGGVAFSAISVIVLTPDPSESNHYAVQIAGIDGDLLCSASSGRPLSFAGTVDFQCAEGTVTLPQGIYTIVLSSNLAAQSGVRTRAVRAVRGHKSRLEIPFGSSTAALLGATAQFMTSYFNGSEDVKAVDGAVIGPLGSAKLNSAVLGDIPAFRLH